MSDAPCTSSEALNRARVQLVKGGGQYLLGTGNYKPNNDTDPWTYRNSELGSDCAGFAICYCWKLVRHRPRFNHGPWATVEDDINVNSILEDAVHKQELAEGVVTKPELGDLICYPTFQYRDRGKKFIGHVAIINCVPASFQPGRYDTLAIIQCHGPDRFKPGVVATDGSLFLHHDSLWPKDEHRTKIVRMKERT